MLHRRWTRGELILLLLGVAAVGFVIFAVTRSSGGGGAQAAGGLSKKASPTAAAARGYQELAALTSSQEVLATPGGRPLRQIAATRPITGEHTVLPVVGAATQDGARWLRVELPGRPNGLTGWIEQSAAKLEYTPWRIIVNIARRQVYAYDAGRLAGSFRAVVGAPATPTPKGSFFIEENVAEPPTAVGHPYALALSARSTVFQEFAGGPGQIALHGLDNVGGTPGTAASHGCLRLDTHDITWLAHRVDPGVPVIIR